MKTRLTSITRMGELIRFGLVGVANTVIYYGFYRLYLLALPYLLAHVVAFACAVVASFFMNCYFTFKVKPTWRRLILFPSTTLVNFVVSTVGTYALVTWAHIDQRWASLVAAIVAVPFTFVITRYVLREDSVPYTLSEE